MNTSNEKLGFNENQYLFGENGNYKGSVYSVPENQELLNNFLTSFYELKKLIESKEMENLNIDDISIKKINIFFEILEKQINGEGSQYLEYNENNPFYFPILKSLIAEIEYLFKIFNENKKYSNIENLKGIDQIIEKIQFFFTKSQEKGTEYNITFLRHFEIFFTKTLLAFNKIKNTYSKEQFLNFKKSVEELINNKPNNIELNIKSIIFNNNINYSEEIPKNNGRDIRSPLEVFSIMLIEKLNFFSKNNFNKENLKEYIISYINLVAQYYYKEYDNYELYNKISLLDNKLFDSKSDLNEIQTQNLVFNIIDDN